MDLVADAGDLAFAQLVLARRHWVYSAITEVLSGADPSTLQPPDSLVRADWALAPMLAAQRPEAFLGQEWAPLQQPLASGGVQFDISDDFFQEMIVSGALRALQDQELRAEQEVTERRYDEHEVAAIFERATARLMEGDRSGSSSKALTTGLTLQELQRIGSEVGIPPEMIEESASMIQVGARPVTVTKKHFGMPARVSGTFALPRDLTDREWEQLRRHP